MFKGVSQEFLFMCVSWLIEICGKGGAIARDKVFNVFVFVSFFEFMWIVVPLVLWVFVGVWIRVVFILGIEMLNKLEFVFDDVIRFLRIDDLFFGINLVMLLKEELFA